MGNEERRFLLELARKRGHLYLDETVDLRPEGGSEPVEVRDPDSGSVTHIELPDGPNGSPIERKLAADTTFEDNEDLLNDLHRWRCEALALVAMQGTTSDSCYENPWVDDDVLEQWPDAGLSELEDALRQTQRPYYEVASLLLRKGDVDLELATLTFFSAARNARGHHEPWVSKLDIGLNHIANIRSQLLAANLRLVMQVASIYSRKLRWSVALRVGLQGLNRAIDLFDVHRGLQLSTYATWWIRQAVDRAAKNAGETLRLPVYREEEIRKVYRERFAVAVPGELNDGESRTQRLPLPIEKLDALAARASRLDEIGIWGRALGSTLIDPDWEELLNFDRRYAEYMFNSRLEATLSFDTEKWKKQKDPERLLKIVRYRTGFGVPSGRTLEQIGQEFNLTRERIRQLESKAFGDILSQWPAMADHLRWYDGL